MKKLIGMVLALMLVFAAGQPVLAEEKPEDTEITVEFNGGIVFGDSEADVMDKEKIKLTKEYVDGMTVLGADKVKLRGIGKSSLNYCFHNGELVQVYEYYNEKCSSAQGKKDYAAVGKDLTKTLGNPLPESEHFEVTTLGFDVDEYVATLRRYGSDVTVQRSMWSIPNGEKRIVVDHVGLDFGDMYKHYLFFLITDAPEAVNP